MEVLPACSVPLNYFVAPDKPCLTQSGVTREAEQLSYGITRLLQ